MNNEEDMDLEDALDFLARNAELIDGVLSEGSQASAAVYQLLRVVEVALKACDEKMGKIEDLRRANNSLLRMLEKKSAMASMAEYQHDVIKKVQRNCTFLNDRTRDMVVEVLEDFEECT